MTVFCKVSFQGQKVYTLKGPLEVIWLDPAPGVIGPALTTYLNCIYNS